MMGGGAPLPCSVNAGWEGGGAVEKRRHPISVLSRVNIFTHLSRIESESRAHRRHSNATVDCLDTVPCCFFCFFLFFLGGGWGASSMASLESSHVSTILEIGGECIV